MRIYTLMIALLMSSLVFTGCGDDDDDDDNGPSGGGNSLTIDGNEASLNSTTAEDSEAGGSNTRVIIFIGSDGENFSIGISGGSNVDPGDYEVATPTNPQSDITVSYTEGNNAGFLVQSGTVTLSTNSADRVEGSFSVEADEVNGDGTRSLEGSFALDVQ